jgi:hypothetical protein
MNDPATRRGIMDFIEPRRQAPLPPRFSRLTLKGDLHGRATAYFAALAAFSINAATSFACARKTAWLLGSSTTCDCARFAMKRSRSGLIIRSCVATIA